VAEIAYMVITTAQGTVTQKSGFSLEDVLARLPRVRATVFGDFCLDAYWWIDQDETEKSVETTLPLRRVRQQRYSLGGAGNVVANLIGLGVKEVRAIGATGEDLFGRELRRQLEEMRVDTSEMVILKAPWQTMVYAKPHRGEQEDNRVDFGSFNALSEEATETLIAALYRAAKTSDIIILNQQIPAGISSPAVIGRINGVISEHPETRFIVDARHRAALYDGAVLKLNTREVTHVLGEVTEQSAIPVTQAKTYAQRLSQKTHQPVFLTRGENGLIVADKDVVHEIPGIQVIERTDSVGAGDTAVAALAAVIGSGGDPVEAATFANIAASITVRKLQTTGIATLEEIRAVGDEPDYVFLPDLAEDSRQAQFVAGTEIELVNPITDGVRIQHAIFDHDGTISTLREGWEQIMEPMMVRAVLGSRYQSVEASLYHEVRETVRQFIDKTTGVQTLVQMQGLVQMVRQCEFVPRNQILDEHGYKRIYNEQLLEMVSQRISKLERGELNARDFQIKDANRLLEHLHERGVKLYLASGTDEADVRAEAEALGYADLFEGRIFGAIGDVKVEAKKVVLERIIREHDLSGHEFVTFGDGPVEIRETRKRGGICIGVASNEVRRFGLNPAKRARLIRAGAQLIVPDFSQLSSLIELLSLA